MAQSKRARRVSSAKSDAPLATVGDRIRFARQQVGFSLEAVGEHIGITGSAVSQWETDTTYPSRKNLLQFAELTGFEPMWLEVGSVSDEARVTKLFEGGQTHVPVVVPGEIADAEDVQAFLSGVAKRLTEAVDTPGKFHEAPPIVATRFACSTLGGFAIEVFDRRNAPLFEVGDLVILSTELTPEMGDMVFASVDPGRRPVFAKYRPWPPKHSVLEPLNSELGAEVIGPGYLDGRILAVMTEHARPRRPLSTGGGF